MQPTTVTILGSPVDRRSGTPLLSVLPFSSRPRAGDPGCPDAVVRTIENARRVCIDKDLRCEWTFIIHTHRVGLVPTPCKFTTYSLGGIPTSQSSQPGAQCSSYSIKSGWSSQFGLDNGFTTLSVTDETYRFVAYPAYTDTQLKWRSLTSALLRMHSDRRDGHNMELPDGLTLPEATDG